MPLTLDPEELRKQWMTLYVNLMVLKSTNEKKMAAIKAVHDDLAQMNEKLVRLFDTLEE